MEATNVFKAKHRSLSSFLTWSSVLQGEVFILELVSVDAFSTSAITASEIATLAHKVRNDTMELAVLEAKALLTSAESSEILYKPKQICLTSTLNPLNPRAICLHQTCKPSIKVRLSSNFINSSNIVISIW